MTDIPSTSSASTNVTDVTESVKTLGWSGATSTEQSTEGVTPRPTHKPDRSQERVETRNREFAIDAARLANDLHCQDVMVLDVRGLSDLTDYLIIGTGTSARQIRGVGDDIEKLASQVELARYGRELDGEGEQPTTWLVLDFVDVVVHLFEAATRGHYDLEMLWGDAPRVTWRREAKA